MKLLIAADMEGVSGVVHWNHVNFRHAEYARFRKVMTADVNAAIDGALRGGAGEVVVADGHSEGDNILLEELDARARLNTGNAAPLAMIQGAAGGIDAAMFVGYHARASSPLGVLNHTWEDHVLNVWWNDTLLGETGINAAVCGYYGAPLLLVSGDQALAEESTALIPGVEAVVVKRATSYFSAECLSLPEAQENIRRGAEKAVRNFLDGKGPQPFQVSTPVTVAVEFASVPQTDSAMKLPGTTRLDGRRVQAAAKDVLAAYSLFRSLVQLSSQ